MAGDINSLNLLVNNNIKSNLYILRLKFMSRMSIFMSSSPLFKILWNVVMLCFYETNYLLAGCILKDTNYQTNYIYMNIPGYQVPRL